LRLSTGDNGSAAPLAFTWDPIKAQSHVAKYGVSFVQAATVLLDALALTVFDAVHSQHEQRWFTLGLSSGGRLLALSHTYQHTGPIDVKVRMISAREATSRERRQYENEPRLVNTMNAQTKHDDDDMPTEIDFSGGRRCRFHKAGAQLNLPVYLKQRVQATLAALAIARSVDFSALINDLLKKDIELIEVAK